MNDDLIQNNISSEVYSPGGTKNAEQDKIYSEDAKALLVMVKPGVKWFKQIVEDEKKKADSFSDLVATVGGNASQSEFDIEKKARLKYVAMLDALLVSFDQAIAKLGQGGDSDE